MLSAYLPPLCNVHTVGMTPGRLITYQLYWNMLNNSYKNLLDIITSFTRAAGAAQRVFSLIDNTPDIGLEDGLAVRSDELRGRIELRNVSFAYQMRPSAKVVNDVSFVIPEGTTCALVGRSGGGKSTLVNLLMRFYDPQEGEILLDGRKYPELKLKDVRNNIGIVQQNTGKRMNNLIDVLWYTLCTIIIYLVCYFNVI